MRRFVYMLALAVVLSGARVFLRVERERVELGGGDRAGDDPDHEREISRVRVDVGSPGRGAGDAEIVRQNLFNRRIRSKPIGYAEFVCTLTTATTRACNVTIFLPKGRLIAGGSIQYQDL